MEDLTKRLRKKARETDCFFNTQSVGVLVANNQGKIIDFNAGLIRMLGYSAEELVGMSEGDLTDRTGQEILDQQLRTREEGKESLYELELKRKDGQKLNVLVSGWPHYIDGNYQGSQGILIDITQRKTLEEKIKNLREMKLSHEIGNKTIGLLGGAKTLRQELTNPDHLILLDAMIEAIEDIEVITENTLQYGTVASRQKEPYDLNDFIKRRVNLMKLSNDFDYHVLREEYHSEPLEVWIDALAFKAVFTNIIKNSLKATETGKLIKIGTKVNQGFAEFYIADQGCGMTPDEKEKIFDPTFSKGGYGLGLSIADENVKLHKGYINVDSAVGSGSTFTVGIPLINRNT